MQSEEQNSHWFGFFGFSSKVFANNNDSFMSLGLLLFKMLVFKLFYAQVLSRCRFSALFRPNLAVVFLIEVLCLVPFFTVSSLVAIWESFDSPYEKLEKAGQAAIFFACLLVLPLWLIERSSEIKRLVARKKKSQRQFLE